MIEFKKLNEAQKEGLRAFVMHRCELCGRHEKEIGKLTPHRGKRGCKGGTYCLGNITMVCNYGGERLLNGKLRASCSKMIHSGEFN
jgi:hypothetical protein